MWIAKPIEALSAAEKQAWCVIARQFAPLSQTLAWAEGMRAVGARPCLVFSPEEKVGGIVFRLTEPSGRVSIECVNGPVLNWDESSAVRQLATFAMAVSKLDTAMGSMSLKPRWKKTQVNCRLARLPIAPVALHESATMLIPIQKTLEEQVGLFEPRLRRTLNKNRPCVTELNWIPADQNELARFVPLMAEYGAKKGFSVPPLSWFYAVRADQRWFLSQARVVDSAGKSAEAELLIAIREKQAGPEAHYLFGREQRSDGAPAWMSASALAQEQVLAHCIRSQIASYDLNGYQVAASKEHPYFGVCQFKEQFGGAVLEYVNPEFRIT
jgi:hypothetical protein